MSEHLPQASFSEEIPSNHCQEQIASLQSQIAAELRIRSLEGTLRNPKELTTVVSLEDMLKAVQSEVYLFMPEPLPNKRKSLRP